MLFRSVFGAENTASQALGNVSKELAQQYTPERKAEMARRESIKRGGIPLQTLRADIDFARERANMTYGVIGIKVWIYRGMKFDTSATVVKKEASK